MPHTPVDQVTTAPPAAGGQQGLLSKNPIYTKRSLHVNSLRGLEFPKLEQRVSHLLILGLFREAFTVNLTRSLSHSFFYLFSFRIKKEHFV